MGGGDRMPSHTFDEIKASIRVCVFFFTPFFAHFWGIQWWAIKYAGLLATTTFFWQSVFYYVCYCCCIVIGAGCCIFGEMFTSISRERDLPIDRFGWIIGSALRLGCMFLMYVIVWILPSGVGQAPTSFNWYQFLISSVLITIAYLFLKREKELELPDRVQV